jgi:hypothetical protein
VPRERLEAMPRDTDGGARWGLCRACRKPGLAYARQFEQAQKPRCGFCGGNLDAVDADLTDLANAVIAEPLRRETCAA